MASDQVADTKHKNLISYFTGIRVNVSTYKRVVNIISCKEFGKLTSWEVQVTIKKQMVGEELKSLVLASYTNFLS